MAIPSRPAWLLPEAKREWSRVTRELERLGMLATIDRALLAAYCQSWGMYVDALHDIGENGSTFKTTTGYEAPRPAVGIAVKMMEKMIALGARFGLSPSDRGRISVPEPKAEDEFTSYMKEKQAAK